ncbi:MAG: hypothetical protein WC761_01890 [Candidatus Paceibacterota bacterium]|jgi:hypothetical protein
MAGRKSRSKFNKTTMLLKFEHNQILELRKVLFANGLTFHQFFGFIIDQLTVNDERLLSLLKEAQNYKKQRILDGKEEDVDPETLYRMIENELNK